MRFYSIGYLDTFPAHPGTACKSHMGNGMPSVSLDQFLASVLLAFLLLMTVPATLADPTGATIDGAKRAQETRSSLAGIGSEHTTAQPKPLLPTMAPTELTI